MKVIVGAKELSETIKDVSRAVDQIQALTLVAGKSLTVTAQGSGKAIAIKVKDAKVEGKGTFTVKPEILTGILKNRKEIEMELKDNEVHFKAPSSKAYSGHFVTLPSEKIDIEGDGDPLAFTDEFVKALSDVVGATSINDVHLGKMNPLPIFLKMSEKGTEISCCNDSHLAYARTKVGKFKAETLLCLPAGTLPLINSIAKNVSYKLAATESSLYAANEAFRYRVPLEQFDQAITLDDAKGLLKQLKSAKSAGSITIKTPDLIKTVDNLLSVYEENVPVEMQVKKDTLRLSTKTGYGSVSDAIKGENAKDTSTAVSLHPHVFNDIISRVKGASLTLTVVKDSCLMMETNADGVEYTYTCILL